MELVARLNNWWPYREKIRFQLVKGIVLIISETANLPECIGIMRKSTVSLFGTHEASIIKSHIIRVCGASLPPTDIKIEMLCDPPRYKSDLPRAPTPSSSHE